MGHRALVAYARGDGRYDLHYSQWGGADLTLAGRLSAPAADPVADEPVAAGVDFVAVVADHLDPLVHEALYVLDEQPRAYRTLWLGDDATPDGGAAGLLVEVAWADPCDDARVRAWGRGARAVAGACRERGLLSAPEAATLVERCLRAWAGDRAVVRPPARARE